MSKMTELTELLPDNMFFQTQVDECWGQIEVEKGLHYIECEVYEDLSKKGASFHFVIYAELTPVGTDFAFHFTKKLDCPEKAAECIMKFVNDVMRLKKGDTISKREEYLKYREQAKNWIKSGTVSPKETLDEMVLRNPIEGLAWNDAIGESLEEAFGPIIEGDTIGRRSE